MIRTRKARVLVNGLLLHCNTQLTDEENLRTASGSEVCGTDWEPISFCQSVEDAELNSESDAYTVGTLLVVRIGLMMISTEMRAKVNSSYAEDLLKDRLGGILQLSYQIFCRR